MMEEIWKVLKTAVTLADDIQKYNTELKEIREELRDLTIIVHALAQENKHAKETSKLINDNLLLELERRLQSIEKGLPPKKPAKKTPAKKTPKKKLSSN